MCGLFGQLGSPLSEPRQRAVLQALQGRGPDGHGQHLEPLGQGDTQWLSLLHTRLAIQDLSPWVISPWPAQRGTFGWCSTVRSTTNGSCARSCST